MFGEIIYFSNKLITLLYLNTDGEKMKGISMFKIKEILRLKCKAKLSNRKIARALNISHRVVNTYTKEFSNSNKRYDDIISLSDKEILTLLKETRISEPKYPLPDFGKVWHGYLHNATIADAILDRIVHNAYKIEIEGGSQRKENAKKVMK